MTFFIKSDNTVKLSPSWTVVVNEVLEPLTYTITVTPAGEYFLTVSDTMTLPPKMYGDDPTKRADRIINTFHNRSKSTGVMLSGEKGSGKTLLVKLIAQKLLNTGTPVLLVNHGFSDPAFIEFINDISTPCLIVFDEFEKLYDEFDQNALLSLLDGTSSSKHLFALTTNNPKINEYMLNRPGRIYYEFSYGSLDENVISGYAAEHLIDKSQLQGVVDFANLFSSFNFDMLQALIEEMNRYGETAKQVGQILNVSPGNESTEYTIEVDVDGKPYPGNTYPYYLDRNPLDMTTTFDVELRAKLNDDGSYPEDGHGNCVRIPSIPIGKETFSGIFKGGMITFTHVVGTSTRVVKFIKRKPFNWKAV